MELSAETLEMLRDEAYVFLCREVVQEKLDALAQEKAAIASTRPPFGVFARKSTRDAFTQSMRTALDSESALRDRLAQITRLEDWLHPLIRRDIVAYMEAVSVDYRRFPQIEALLVEWERGMQALPEMLVALTRDMRGLREAMAAGRRDVAQEFAVLRDIAVRVENHYLELARASVAVAEHARAIGSAEIRVPALPNLQRVTWVSRLGVMPVEQVVAEIARVESEVRAFITGGVEPATVRLQMARELCAQLQENFLQSYWNQLRTHARIHYVEERDLDEVLISLAQRYVDGTIAKRQQALATNNPFLAER